MIGSSEEDADGPKMVFHAPMDLAALGMSPVAQRPREMRRAFQSLGYDVVTVDGPARQRRSSFRKLIELVDQGLDVDFVYSEFSTLPMAMTQPARSGLHPFLDFINLRRLRKRGVPVGAFYRDVYWQFDAFKGDRSARRLALELFYRLDALLIPFAVDWLFVPSMKMAPYVSFPRRRVSALPPGLRLSSSLHPEELKFLYVGSLGDFYKLHLFVEAVVSEPGTSLVLCVPKEHWTALEEEYPLGDSGNVTVVHESGKRLDELMHEASVGVLMTEPSPYRAFAAPFKLYEYFGHGLPVVATRDTNAANIVSQAGVGWVTDYDRDSIKQLIRYLRETPQAIKQAQAATAKYASSQTWEARAEEVSVILREKAT